MRGIFSFQNLRCGFSEIRRTFWKFEILSVINFSYFNFC
ncbi:hypothetical protein LEP1GSC125_1681 [Leptospira mayottensis 200901122]|uniref:Uncharacterized protein n=1 Tax=Leptospira mayottensis 200901122 TaxID=1193010 RepID=A0AA87SVY5_9LEPT|nr:hypothetical protein LEP1GSC125_1681 [Leptospira mayottensis 200901122]